MGRKVALTASSIDGSDFANPRVIYVEENDILIFPPSSSGKKTRIVERNSARETVYRVYEKALQIEIARNPTSTDLYLKKYIQTALAGVGTTQAGATAILAATYLAEALTIGAAATEAFVLPAAVVGMLIVVINNDVAADAAKIFPAVGQFHKGQAVNTVFSLPAGQRVHFVCLATGIWTRADDYGT